MNNANIILLSRLYSLTSIPVVGFVKFSSKEKKSKMKRFAAKEKFSLKLFGFIIFFYRTTLGRHLHVSIIFCCSFVAVPLSTEFRLQFMSKISSFLVLFKSNLHHRLEIPESTSTEISVKNSPRDKKNTAWNINIENMCRKWKNSEKFHGKKKKKCKSIAICYLGFSGGCE